MDAREALAAGQLILEPALVPWGFVFVPAREGESSGGNFASGSFVRGNRSLELHFRYSLGLVTYSTDGLCLAHSEYMRSLGRRAESEYPGFSSDPLDGFRHLRSDIERFGQEFIEGSDADFRGRFEWAAANPVPKGIAAT
ncbi:MAG: hypothetical protein HGA39_09715 [Coriobacteriia bacterium]|nr:hypothetical protein [Coriobacteriia bacterium]